MRHHPSCLLVHALPSFLNGQLEKTPSLFEREFLLWFQRFSVRHRFLSRTTVRFGLLTVYSTHAAFPPQDQFAGVVSSGGGVRKRAASRCSNGSGKFKRTNGAAEVRTGMTASRAAAVLD